MEETRKNLPKRPTKVLLTLDGPVNVTDKEQRGTETHSPKHEKEAIADASHVAEEKRGLHKT